MPPLFRKLLICAAADGLLLQPISAKDRSTESNALQLTYGSNRIAQSSEKVEDDSKGASLEAHGIVGLLDLVSTKYLIAISRREQVAQIRGKPVYTIADVALIPLSSQAEAKHAIDALHKVSDHGKTTSGYESEDSDYVDDDDNGSVDEEHAPSQDTTKQGVLGASTSFVKNVVQERGNYGRFAERWFSKGGWRNDGRRKQGMTEQGSDLTPEQRQQAAESLPSGQEQTEAKEELKGSDNDQGAVKVEETPESDGTNLPPKEKTTIETLSKRILRTTRLYFTSKNFFFSYDHDLSTRWSEQSGASSTTPLYKRFESIFFWNQHLLQPFISAGQDQFILPLIQGFVGQRAFSLDKSESGEKAVVSEAADDTAETVKAQEQPTTQSDNHDFLLTIISRRSVKRAGLRYLRRGIDDEGNVANCVETEQILSSQSWDASGKTFSFVQVRGSIPLFYTQSPYSFKPLPQTFGSESTNHTAFKKHFSLLTERYGKVQVANLVDKHGTENGIGEAYEKSAKWLNESEGSNGPQIGFEWFDFHHECKGMRFENVSILLKTLEKPLRSSGWATQQGEQFSSKQQGVLRTNCMDCLDRTNVTQSSVAGWVLQQQLAELDLPIDLQTDPKSIWFNQLWADNGDAISKQYAGTAALKGDFTRTRKRNWTGALSDFSLTLNRYYNNAFGDFFLQTCIDYNLGYVDSSVFDDFETNMQSQDYALDVRRIRQNAIDVCAKIVLEDPKETLVGGWTLSCPHQANTLRSLPFEECVLLLTNAAVYFCRFDWNSEKVGSFERVDLTDITEIWRGPYITSILGPIHLDESRNVGFAFKYHTHGQAIVRTNTRTVANEKKAEDQNEGKDELAKQAEPHKDESRLLAFKMLASKASASRKEGDDYLSMSESEMAKRICEEIHAGMIDALKAERGVDHLQLNEFPKLEENAVISTADAKKATGYIETLGYSLKKLVW